MTQAVDARRRERVAIRYTGIADEEDGGAVAILAEFPDGTQVWSGEVSRDLFDEQDADTRSALGDDSGQFVVVARPGDGATIIAKAPDRWVAMDLATAYAEWLANAAALNAYRDGKR